MTQRRVVVTGLGTITSLGADVDTFWSNILAGKSGVSTIENIDTSDMTTHIGAEIKDFDIELFMSRKDARRLDRSSQLFWVATQQALNDAGLSYEEDDPEALRAGVLAGTGIGGIDTMEEQMKVMFERGPSRMSPLGIAKIISNMAGGVASIDFHLYGPNSTTVTACAASANAIGDAAAVIQRGAADVMVAGGAEASITRFAMGGFAQARALSTNNDDPAGASRPFDADRDGFVMGRVQPWSSWRNMNTPWRGAPPSTGSFSATACQPMAITSRFLDPGSGRSQSNARCTRRGWHGAR